MAAGNQATQQCPCLLTLVQELPVTACATQLNLVLARVY